MIDADDVDAVVIATPVSTHSPARDVARSRRASTSSSRSRLRLRRATRPSWRRRPPQQRTRAHARSHVPLQPAGRCDPRPHRLRRARGALFISSSRVNLGLHQSDVSVVWDLGPHDFSILRYWLGETPLTSAPRARLRHPAIDRTSPSSISSTLGADRPCRAVVARPEQAAADDDRRLREDGRLRRHERTSRFASSTPASTSGILRRSASSG